MFFDTRQTAPRSVRWARVIVPLFLCFAYAAFRVAPAVHGMIPGAEVVTMGLVFAGLMLVAFAALSDLIYPRADRATDDAAERPLLEQAPEDALDWGRIEGDLLATLEGNWPGRAEVKAQLIRRAYGYDPDEAATEELELLTHDYHPQHHTPARGFAAVEPDQLGDISWNAYTAGQNRVEVAPGGEPFTVQGTITGRIPSPAPRSGGRHRLTKADAR